MFRMILATSLAGFAIAPGVAQSVLPSPVMMQDLTVPHERLPAGCALSPVESMPLDGHRFRGGLWAGLPIPTNPWTGTDRRIVASIRERMAAPILAPDGPPLTARELSSYRLRLADGVEEAYAAIYLQSEPELIVVYASRFAGPERPDDRPSDTRASRNPRVIRMTIGPIVAVVQGDGGQCFQAVEAYLKTLAR
jgi:hypothetical protein